MFDIKWTRRASRNLEKLERDTIIRIIKKVEIAKKDPYFYLKRLVKEKVWKLRVGDYRIFVDIDSEKEILYILGVGHRRKVYKK